VSKDQLVFAQIEGAPPAWHRCQDAVLQPQCLASEAVTLLNADFTVEKQPLYRQDYYGIFQLVEGQVALVRPPLPKDPEERVLDIVSESYEIIQYTDFARMLEPLSQRWNIESIGLLGRGEVLYIMFRTGEMSVNGDDFQTFLTLHEHKDGRAAGATDHQNRIVCRNTFEAAMASGNARIRVPHERGANLELDFCTQLMTAHIARQDEIKGQLVRFAMQPLYASQVSGILERVYPTPAKPRRAELLARGAEFTAQYADLQTMATADLEKWEAMRANSERLRFTVLQEYYKENERNRYPGTKWALHVAGTAVENHRTGKGSRRVGESILFGSRGESMKRLFKELVAV
jgi:hypothetical protein